MKHLCSILLMLAIFSATTESHAPREEYRAPHPARTRSYSPLARPRDRRTVVAPSAHLQLPATNRFEDLDKYVVRVIQKFMQYQPVAFAGNAADGLSSDLIIRFREATIRPGLTPIRINIAPNMCEFIQHTVPLLSPDQINALGLQYLLPEQLEMHAEALNRHALMYGSKSYFDTYFKHDLTSQEWATAEETRLGRGVGPGVRLWIEEARQDRMFGNSSLPDYAPSCSIL